MYMKKIEIWKICAYFIIYSVLGFIIETTFAFIAYHVIESRQSFLYGPFCSIYGVGAIIMIVVLRRFENSNIKLLLGGILLGALVEYSISFLGEKILGMRFWDYSNSFLNINGRICILYSVFWGIAAFVLINFLNPKIDKVIDNICNTEQKTSNIKNTICIILIFMILDGVITYVFVNYFIVYSAEKYNLELSNEKQIGKFYHFVQKKPILKEKLEKYITAERMILVFPNLSTILKDGTQFKLQNLTPEVRNCYYRF